MNVGKQVFLFTGTGILLLFFFWRLNCEVTWIYSSLCWVVHDKKMFMQYQLVRTHKPSVQHKKSLAAPKCMNNLEWYVRCKGQERTEFLLEIFWYNVFFLKRNVCTVSYPSASCGGSGRCFQHKVEMEQLGFDTKQKLDVILHPSKHLRCPDLEINRK